MYGVWASIGSRAIITQKWILTYHKTNNEIASRLYRRVNVADAAYEIIAATAACVDGRWHSVAYGKHGAVHEYFTHDSMIEARPGLRVCPQSAGSTVKHCGMDEGGTLTLVESFSMSGSRSVRSATQENIAVCLVDWNVGTTEFHGDDGTGSMSVSVNTSRNWHIFEVWNTPEYHSMYCRCARIGATNLGLLFEQNIRMNASTENEMFEWHFEDSSVDTLSGALIVDETRFHANTCTFDGTSDKPWRRAYWSLKTHRDDLIVLHGCNGAEYEYRRPDKNPLITEQFSVD